MPRNRYKELIQYLQFDIRSSRSERPKGDKFCLYGVDSLITAIKACSLANADITVDEQLFATKSRYSFTQYIAR